MTSLLIVFTVLFLITLSHEGDFPCLAFEVTSASGTVGLSRGATGELDGFGRAVIIAVMFIGRVGPLTLGLLLATRSKPRVGDPPGTMFLGQVHGPGAPRPVWAQILSNFQETVTVPG